MSVRVEPIFEGKEAEEFLAKLEEKRKRVSNADKQLLALLTSIAFRDVQDHFDNEQGSGEPWAPWSEAYRAYMNRIGKGSNNLLRDTGALRNAFAPATQQNMGEFQWINPLPYSATHNYGDKARNIPQREFMWMSNDALENAAEICLAFVLDEK